MKAVFVNATERTVTDIEIEKGLKPLYDMIGCRLVDVVQLEDNDDLFVDDEGLLNIEPSTPLFRIGVLTLAGNGVIVGGDDETGESCDVHRDADHYRPLITFTHAAANALRRMLTSELNNQSPF